jgi:hypothetical protein
MDWFKDDGIFLPMINDTGRNRFYKSAIEFAVPNKTVCDIGTGTGLLTVLAIKAGARKVFAVEQNPKRAELARQMFDQVGISHKVEVIVDDFLNTNICADLYVSETINTQIFGENILELAKHAGRLGGEFIPARFEITMQLYQEHPIFNLCQMRSDAFEFQPDIAIDPGFENSINAEFQSRHPLSDTLYRANVLNGLFHELPKFSDLTLTKICHSTPLIVDLNQQTDPAQIKLCIAKNSVPTNTNVYAVLHWRAFYNDCVLDVNNTWFGNVSKTILHRCRDVNKDIVAWYDPSIKDWRFSF